MKAHPLDASRFRPLLQRRREKICGLSAKRPHALASWIREKHRRGEEKRNGEIINLLSSSFNCFWKAFGEKRISLSTSLLALREADGMSNLLIM